MNDRGDFLNTSTMLYSLGQDRNNNDPEYSDFIKRRGASLVRPEYSRQRSFNNNNDKDQTLKRNSVLDPSKVEGNQTGGTKIMNFFKSGLSLSKFKSKSKLNLQDNKALVFFDPLSSKSEENLIDLNFDSYLTPIRSSNLILNDYDPTLYSDTSTLEKDSLYKPLVTLDKDCRIQQVHPSIVNGLNHCFQIVKQPITQIVTSPLYVYNANNEYFGSSQITKSCSYNSSFRDSKSSFRTCESVNIVRCSSAIQRNEWIMRIKRHINPNIELTVRHEDILKIWIQEAKNLLPKKRYYCEIRLDQILYGKTTEKLMNDMVFWGEEFEFMGLENVNIISVSVYRMLDAKRKRDKSELVALINLPCDEVLHNSFTEKWYSPSPDIKVSSEHLRFSQSIPTKISKSNTLSPDQMKSLIDSTPTLRIKARYRPLEIIPTQCYDPLVEFLIKDNISLMISLESHLKVKSKEEFVNTLLLILQKKERHILFLSDAVLMEVYNADDNLILRGNTMASKAMECYLKIVGEKYLSSILSDMISDVTSNNIDCEVDPLRIQNIKDSSVIKNNQKKLLKLVENVWKKISTSCSLFPNDLKIIFSIIREKLSISRRVSSNSSHMIDQVISSCLFLRYICPAIMSPFLFGLSKEYSDKPYINRTFTLIAKCIQSLANFSQYSHGKETYMSFFQDFLSNNNYQMHNFLMQISIKSPLQNTDYIIDIQQNNSPKCEMFVDFGYQLAELSYQLSIHLRDIPTKDYTPTLSQCRLILENISKIFPNIETEEENVHNNVTTFNTFRSQIPIPIQRRVSALERRCTALSSIQCSPVMKKNEEEDFSYIPTKYSSTLNNSKNESPKKSTENYVDFERIEARHYDEAFNDRLSLTITEQKVKYLNEKEINYNWTKIVTESYSNNSFGNTLTIDPSSCTINSSGYESLNFPPKPLTQSEIQANTLQRLFSNTLGKSFDNIANLKSSAKNSPKLTPNRQANIYRRIKRNTNTNTFTNNSTNYGDSEKNKDFSYTLNASCDIMGSLENVSGSEKSGLKNCQSMTSVYQKKTLNSKDNQTSFNGKSMEKEESSMVNLFRRSSQSLSNSISSNLDLDSFITNELTRLQLFIKYFEVKKPSVYQGNAVEQYKCKTLDENILRKMVVISVEPSREDIIKYIMASYRLLKSIHKPAQISTEFVIKFVIEVNQKIQLIISKQLQWDMPTNDNMSDIDIPKVTRVQSDDRNAFFLLSSQSLPPPANKYSKQSPKNSPTLARSRETNSSKNLTVVDVFERC